MLESRKATPKNHLASLDGLRAVSILFVIVCHGAVTIGYRSDLFLYYGQLGVSIFFVISGTLITWLMIREEEETASVSLLNFYIRRALRILPVFWLLILCVIALKAIHIISIGNMDILRAVTFTHNYPLPGNKDYAWWLGHTWSLSLEEQFYLIWPGLFVFFSRKKAIYISSILAFSGPVLRLASYYLLPSLRSHEPGMLHTRIDTLMMGCVAAFLLDSATWREWLKKVSADRWLIPLAFFLLAIEPFVMMHLTGHIHSDVGAGMATIEAFAIASIVLLLVAGKAGIAHAVFNSRVIVHVGTLSYSLYIWQQLLLEPDSSFNFWTLAWRIPGIYVVSLCSFNYLEKPLLRLRKRFRKVPVE